ncbi:sensor histidine kinase [uncultured Candidatus Thioglobus sp.]|nr:sensor histidine kinase [uncultured Candidatus Thioglobus sp.]
MRQERITYLFYPVAFIVGLTICATLVFIAWDISLEEKNRDFVFEYSKVKEEVVHNIRLSSDVIDFFSISTKTWKDSDDVMFQSFARNILDKKNFIEGLFYLNSKEFNGLKKQLYLKNAKFRDTQVEKDFTELFDHEDFDRIVQLLLLEQDQSNAIAAMINLQSSDYYVLFRAVQNRVLCLLINPEKIIPLANIAPTLMIQLYNESLNLSGRQLIFNSTDIALHNRKGLLITRFSQDAAIRLPAYSLTLSVSKKIYWKDINHNLIYIALLLGFGTTFLLIALVRVDNLRNRELMSRNILIESKVEEQTKELVLAKDEAQEATRIKSEFLASMSHEIRTPLAAIISMAELLSETKLNDMQGKYVGVFRKAGDTLLNLVNDILDLSKIEAGQFVLDHIAFDLLEVIEESIELYAITATENDIELMTHMYPTVERQRFGDPTRLKQIICNLISNALKFTKKGHVIVQVANADYEKLRISIRDTGIGIPKAMQEEIFAKFIQVDSSTARKYGGTGLGLAISKYLVEVMDGHMELESELGIGSTFSFIVDIPVQAHVVHDPEQFILLRNITVLVLDSNVLHKQNIFEVLHEFGASCTESRVDVLTADLCSKYQYILLDYKILLEWEDDTIAEFKKLQQANNHLVIAMLTHFSLDQKIEHIKQLGIQHYLTKPIKQSELLNILSNPDHVVTASERDSELLELPSVQKRILLVDDTVDNRLLIKAYLSKSGYIIDEAENGETAINYYHENTYDLIFMDIQMPNMDGHEATQAIRMLEKKSMRRWTPIIAITAHATKEEVQKCMTAGCDSYLSKPFKRAILLQAIKDFIN